jgi:hypothetical protein
MLETSTYHYQAEMVKKAITKGKKTHLAAAAAGGEPL